MITYVLIIAIPFLLGMFVSFIVIDPVKEWKDGFNSAEQLYYNRDIVTCKHCIHKDGSDTECPIRWAKTDKDYCSFSDVKEDD